MIHAVMVLAAMQGSWTGEGERVQIISGRRTSIEAKVEAAVYGDRLYSHSVITETPLSGADAAKKTYSRDYWIQHITDDDYILGIRDQMLATGRVVDGAFRVDQKFAGTSPYVVHSRTTFDGDRSAYDEDFTAENHVLARTHIAYRRILGR